MIIMGLSGWFERGHDAAACLFIDGKLVTMAEEERFTRKRYAYDCLPLQAAYWCLLKADFPFEAVDEIAIGWDIPALYRQAGRQIPFSDESALRELLFPKYLFGSGKARIRFVNHHLAHAASVHAMIKDDDVAILIIDGQGETEATSLWHVHNNEFQKLASFPVSHSLGYFFEAVSRRCGFSTTHAGKVMGLAAYGRDRGWPEPFETTIQGYQPTIAIPDQSESLDSQATVTRSWEQFFEAQGMPSGKRQYRFSNATGKIDYDTEFYTETADLAHWAQQAVCGVVCHLAQIIVSQCYTRSLGLAGGVALNCSVNGTILEQLESIHQLAVQPASLDSGVALGAAVIAAIEAGDQVSLASFPYCGPSYSRASFTQTLQDSGVRYEQPSDIAANIADRLLNHQTIAWFVGPAEIGPRALGQRSLLALPYGETVKDQVNRIKHRELWRPLAPSMLAEDVSRHFNKTPSPYMLTSLPMHSAQELSAVVHVDGSCRPHLVDDEQSIYYQLLVRLKELTGSSVILNTSLNHAGEPIVHSPYDALKLFATRPIDVLVLGPYLIERNKLQ